MDWMFIEGLILGILAGYLLGAMFVWWIVRKKAIKLNVWNELNETKVKHV
jgi:H+/gluconate symporter-like permease